MERSEPSLVPEWLKSSGSVSGAVASTHQFANSLLHSDDRLISRSTRNKILAKSSDNEIERSPFSNQTTSSYFRRASSSNGSSNIRSYSSFGWNHRDKNQAEEFYDDRDREKSVLGNHRHHDYSEPMGNIFLHRLEKEKLRRSQSTLSGKSGETWMKNVVADSSIVSRNNHNNGSALNISASSFGSGHKGLFERDFPSLGAEERVVDSEIGRALSPGSTTVILSLPIANSALIRGDVWTSALAEVPVIVGNGNNAPSLQQAVCASSGSNASVRNMAETLAQVTPRPQIPSQLSSGTQRLEELAVKQSRQLIPVTPSSPKPLTSSLSDKQKSKVGQQQPQQQNPSLINHSPCGGSTKADVLKMSTLRKLQVLKPARERSGMSFSATKDSFSPTSGSNLPNSPIAVSPFVVGSAPPKTITKSPVLAGAERKQNVPILEKKPSSQAQSRYLVRKKSLSNSSSVAPEPSPSGSNPVFGKPDETGSPIPPGTVGSGELSVDHSAGVSQLVDSKFGLVCDADDCDGIKGFSYKRKNHLGSEALRYSEEEEAAFLRSLGWEDNAGEDEGLTEEEITTFYRDVSKYLNSKTGVLQGMKLKWSLPRLQMGNLFSDSKRES